MLQKMNLLHQHNRRLNGGPVNGFQLIPMELPTQQAFVHQRNVRMALQTTVWAQKYRHQLVDKPRENRASTVTNYAPSSLSKTFGETLWSDSVRTYESGIAGLHAGIEDFCVSMSPTPAEKRTRQDPEIRISKVIKEKFPEATADYFRSFRTGLFFPTSDINMVVFGKWEASSHLRELLTPLIASDICTSGESKVLDKTSVSITNMTHHRTDVEVNISFNTTNAVNNARLIES